MAWMRRWFLLGCFVTGVTASLLVLWLDARVRAYLAGPPLGSARIYAAPTVLRPGAPVPRGGLVRALARLGYRPGGTLAPGEFRADGGTIDVAARPSPAPWAPPPRWARVVVRDGAVAELRDRAGRPLDQFELDPEVLALLGAGGPSLDPGGEAAPAVCRAAVLAAEDRHFFHHPGVDPLAVARALWTNVRAGERLQGGSTITQQLAKNAFLSPRRTVRRKIEEAVLAILLEARATKEQILRRYLASVYLGVDGGLPVHGLAQGAEVYFGKPLGQLGPAECALLAGIIRAPNGLAPRRRPRAALARRNHVLALMVSDGSLDAATAARARAEPLRLAAPRARAVAALYVAAQVRRELARVVAPEVAAAPGLAVFTGIDADAQREAERAVRRQLAAVERGRRRREPLQAALVALDPYTGQVRALVGGRDYGSSPLDRALRARRQPGSAFKPFVYLAALDPGSRGAARPWTVVSTVDDSPVTVRSGGRLWQPANYDGSFAGPLPLEDALAESRNAATVRLALDVGLGAVARAATNLGLRGPFPPVPALALGVAETSLLELAAAYGVFASGGVWRRPALVVGVVSASGETVYAAPRMERRVLAPGVAYLMTYLLERVVDVGTGRGARAAGLTGAAAGKTGTTDDTRDAWFIGFTPELVAGVWVGLDRGGPTGLTGAQGALPIWTEFVRAISPGAERAFPVPEDVVWREVDPATGLLATSGCPERRREPFLAATAPELPCDRHRPLWTAVGEGVAGAVRGGGQAVGAGGRRAFGWLGRLFR
jgi:penicillin-binding protein 1B